MIKLDDQAFIDGFDPVIEIIPSKQVPRKLVIRSYDKDFTFLLKGLCLVSELSLNKNADDQEMRI